MTVAYLGWSGTVSSFAFDSDGYATQFAHGNRSKLVNVSVELRHLMEQGAVPRLQTAQRSAPTQLAAPAADHRVLDWIDKIETLSTTAAKRRHLQKAIDDLRTSHLSPELQARHIEQLEAHLRTL